MNNADIGKKQLREHFKQVRKDLGEKARKEADSAIAERLFASDIWHNANTVLSYLSFGDEVETRPIIERAWDEGKTVAIPRCATVTDAHVMQWYRIENFEGLQRNSFGIEEPAAAGTTRINIPILDEDSVTLVPGIVFDRQGNRCGYGGGYFDTFLVRFAGRSIGLCRDVQLCDDLCEYAAFNDRDQRVDVVVTESQQIVT